MSLRAGYLVALFLLVGFHGLAQRDSGIRQTKQNDPFKFKENQIFIGTAIHRTSTTLKLSASNESKISISNSVLNEVGTAFTGLYNIQNQVLALRVGNRKSRILDFRSHVGMKGWEAKAMGSFSKKRSSTFDLNYRFSLEDMFMSGQGHRLMLMTKF